MIVSPNVEVVLYETAALIDEAFLYAITALIVAAFLYAITAQIVAAFLYETAALYGERARYGTAAQLDSASRNSIAQHAGRNLRAASCQQPQRPTSPTSKTPLCSARQVHAQKAPYEAKQALTKASTGLTAEPQCDAAICRQVNPP